MKKFMKTLLPIWVQRVLRRILYHYRLARYQSKIIDRNIFGEKVRIYIGDPIAENWYGHDISMLPSFDLIEKKLISKDVTVLYIGAHYAVYAIAFAKKLGLGSRVIALEANPQHVNFAIKNCQLNDCKNVKIIHGAISNISGSLNFTLGHTVSVNDKSIPIFNVNSFTIDELTQTEGEPNLVIIDVEGYEQKALEGAPQLLEKNSLWCVEIHAGGGLEKFGGSLKEVISFFKRDSYDILMSQDYGRDGVRSFDANDPLTKGRFHLIAIPVAFNK